MEVYNISIQIVLVVEACIIHAVPFRYNTPPAQIQMALKSCGGIS